jgi:ectoine hydroxylase-related dioxygenase (phytanoyl-CoA dioxygenase family)
MDDWFSSLVSNSELSDKTAQELDENGFILIPGPVANANLPKLADAYDSAVSLSAPEDVSVGRTTTRVSDFVNRSPDFDALYIYQPILAACCRVIGRPFKLSTLHARTVNPNSSAQALHVDFQREAEGYPMVGFILMVDEFRTDNGATRFVPGSHHWSNGQGDLMKNADPDHEQQRLACGPPGSIVIYNGSTWHGHSANKTSIPRRSIQGAYIRRDAESSINLPARMTRETLARIDPLAKYIIGV